MNYNELALTAQIVAEITQFKANNVSVQAYVTIVERRNELSQIQAELLDKKKRSLGSAFVTLGKV